MTVEGRDGQTSGVHTKCEDPQIVGLLKNQAMVSSVCSSVIHEQNDLVTLSKSVR